MILFTKNPHLNKKKNFFGGRWGWGGGGGARVSKISFTKNPNRKKKKKN